MLTGCWARVCTALMQQGRCIQALAALWSACPQLATQQDALSMWKLLCGCALWQAQSKPGPTSCTSTSLAVHLPSFHVRSRRPWEFAAWAHLSLSLKTRMDVL